MSHAPAYQGPAPGYGAAPQPTNGLGIAGFVCSLLGIISCGALSPIGLILSFIAIFREPRGLAIAGLILGALGSMWVVALAVLIGGAVVVAGIAAVAAGAGLEGVLEVMKDGQTIRASIDQHVGTTGAPPATLGELSGLDAEALTDPWGRPYRYEVGPGNKWKLTSDGKDGAPGGGDDVSFEF